MSTQANTNAYLRTRVLTASPEELRLMLLDGAIKFAVQGRDGLVSRDYERVYDGFSQCRAILVELICGIRDEIDPELGGRVRALYSFIYNELINASFEKDLERADRVVELLQYERETWSLLVAKLAEERAEERAAGDAAPTPRRPTDDGDDAARSALSVHA